MDVSSPRKSAGPAAASCGALCALWAAALGLVLLLGAVLPSAPSCAPGPRAANSCGDAAALEAQRELALWALPPS